ncbi:MAG TPA: nucleotide sugar dehydrogenase [Candidatus Limnocylindrales bacterium]|jgi:GDP-mannose 6-dehydrogenase
MIITIAGLGYVGSVSAACLAKLGHTIIGSDAVPAKMDEVGHGRAPIAEPGLDDLLASAVASGRLSVAAIPDAVPRADLVMVAVGTPSRPDGSLDTADLLRVVEEIGAALPADGRHRTVVIRSTVLPGTVQGPVRAALERTSGLTVGTDVGLAMNPEFLREGSSVRDFFETSRTIVGAEDEPSFAALRAAYAGLEAPLFEVPTAVAELAKYADNAYHAVKIAFANEVGSIAESVGISPSDVLDLLASDRRLNISTAYLRPGMAFGGSCLPKDLRAVQALGRRQSLELPLLGSVLTSNRAHLDRLVARIDAGGSRDVALLGLSFKDSTDDLRESPAVALAQALIERGYQLRIYDPDVHPEMLRGANRRFMEAHLPHLLELLTTSPEAAIGATGTVVVTKVSDDTMTALDRAADRTVVALCELPREPLRPAPALAPIA